MSEREQNCSLCCTKIENFSVKRGNTEILTDINLHNKNYEGMFF